MGWSGKCHLNSTILLILGSTLGHSQASKNSPDSPLHHRSGLHHQPLDAMGPVSGSPKLTDTQRLTKKIMSFHLWTPCCWSIFLGHISGHLKVGWEFSHAFPQVFFGSHLPFDGQQTRRIFGSLLLSASKHGPRRQVLRWRSEATATAGRGALQRAGRFFNGQTCPFWSTSRGV